jgi:hypothetical protein
MSKISKIIEDNIVEYDGEWHKRGENDECVPFIMSDLYELIHQAQKEGYKKGYEDAKE